MCPNAGRKKKMCRQYKVGIMGSNQEKPSYKFLNIMEKIMCGSQKLEKP